MKNSLDGLVAIQERVNDFLKIINHCKQQREKDWRKMNRILETIEIISVVTEEKMEWEWKKILGYNG